SSVRIEPFGRKGPPMATTAAPPGPDATLTAGSTVTTAQRVRRTPGARWLALGPFLTYTLICLGFPTWALVYESLRQTDPVTHVTSYTLANITTSWQGFYLTAMWGSVKLSLLS